MQSLEVQLKVPDFWQQTAITHLREGTDVVVAAPTGAGKTYIFENLIENGFTGQAIYTVPTRALANDKRMEWSRKGWNVGIATGDRAENLDAAVLVATLETQKNRLLQGLGPALLVIDEYQMLGDRQRGLNYELAIATAPPHTQLLLLSGSVGNPGDVVTWLRKLGRAAELVQHTERPVPLEEIQVEALPDRIPPSVRGFWPRVIAKILKAEMAPLLAFAPRRKAAEDLAMAIARMLPEEDPLVLTPEQQRMAGDPLKRLLRARIAFHHSGLDYAQRAGLVEPLAKAGQLRVVVATMGLAAGINFSMRSVLVTDREFRAGDHTHQVRPDELLQMFGRAGRRGLDRIGFVVVAPGKPRLAEARFLQLQRANELDWPSILKVMQTAIEDDEDPVTSARALAARLFSKRQPVIGLANFGRSPTLNRTTAQRKVRQTIQEYQTPDGHWERLRHPRRAPLGQTLARVKGSWIPALQWIDCLANVKVGVTCKIHKSNDRWEYGKEVPVARLAREEEPGDLVLTRWTRKALHSAGLARNKGNSQWNLDALQSLLNRFFPQLAVGGKLFEWRLLQDALIARLEFSSAETYAQIDGTGRPLLNAPVRERSHVACLDVDGDAVEAALRLEGTAADAWYQLGLIDELASPTQRGILFSFFNYGEGLAIAAALEERTYPIEELLRHLANIRAGHRFSEHELSSGRLGMICRSTYREATYPGYLSKGVPTTYGDGAAEVIELGPRGIARSGLTGDLRTGDIERARLEWHSLLRHISLAPDLAWDRWRELKELATRFVEKLPVPVSLDDLPSLTRIQRQRHKSFLRF